MVGVGVGNQTGVPLSKGVQPQVYLREVHATFENYLQTAQNLGVLALSLDDVSWGGKTGRRLGAPRPTIRKLVQTPASITP